tara:strand:- start:21 stop:740 length:720 start_codon:yes stop_codon:yes gene_type:complete
MRNFYKLTSILALAATTTVAQAETEFQGTIGYKSDHIRRAQVIGNDGAYYGNLNFSKAGLSFSVTALESMGGVNNDDAEAIIPFPGDVTEEQFEIGYSASIGQFNFDLKMLDRNSDADVNGLTAEVEERENSISFDVGGLDYTYVDGEILIPDEGDEELGYAAHSIAYTVSNVNFLLGRMRYDTQGAGYDYYEIKTETEMFGLDVSVVLTGVLSIDSIDSDQFDPKDRLVLDFSKSIDL